MSGVYGILPIQRSFFSGSIQYCGYYTILRRALQGLFRTKKRIAAEAIL